jgi:hypothetical protein
MNVRRVLSVEIQVLEWIDGHETCEPKIWGDSEPPKNNHATREPKIAAESKQYRRRENKTFKKVAVQKRGKRKERWPGSSSVVPT